MWELPTVGNIHGLYILTILASAAAVIGSLYGFFKWIRNFFLKRFQEVDARFEKVDARFEKMDARFEMMENRMFQLAMGKTLREIMIQEKLEKKER